MSKHKHGAYVAGPMRGIPEFNFPRFFECQAYLHAIGVRNVANPARHDLDAYPDMRNWPGFATGDISLCPYFSLEAAMRWDLAAVAQAGMIVLLPGWPKSSGAREELRVARICGVDVYTYHADAAVSLQSLSEEREKTMLFNADFSEPAPKPGEIRIVNEATGGEKGSKPARFDLLPSGPLHAVAEHYGKGASKYADHNWRRGYDWSLSFAALQRHALAFWAGEDLDPETESPHLAAVVFHAFSLLEWASTHPELDDRYTRESDTLVP